MVELCLFNLSVYKEQEGERPNKGKYLKKFMVVFPYLFVEKYKQPALHAISSF